MDFAEIHVDQKYHRHIIGKGGTSGKFWTFQPESIVNFFCFLVNRIKTETGTSIIIPPDTEKSDILRIEGDPMGVKAAKLMLLEMAAKMVCPWFSVKYIFSVVVGIKPLKKLLHCRIMSS